MFRVALGHSAISKSGVVLSTGPLKGNIRDLRRVFPAIGLQAYPRGFALSRINQGRRSTLLLPRSFALLHWL